MKNSGLEIKPNNSTNFAEINITGELTIDTVENMIVDINPVTDKFQSFKIVLNDITNIDLSGIQFLISLKKTIKANEKIVEFQMNLSEKFNTLLKSTGLFSLIINK